MRNTLTAKSSRTALQISRQASAIRNNVARLALQMRSASVNREDRICL